MEGCIILIEQALPHLSPSETKVASYILKDPHAAVEENVSTVAQKSGSSAAAVVRLCKRLGFSGYPPFRMSLARSLYSTSDEERKEAFRFDLDQVDSIDEIENMMITSISKNLEAMKLTLSSKLILPVVKLLCGARTIFLSGVGASGLVATDFQQKLSRIGLFSFAPAEPDMQLVHACSLTKADVAVLFSYSGDTEAMLKVARQVKQAGSPLVAITRMGGNSLSRMADIVLQVPDTEPLYRAGATLSRINQLIVVDILYSALIRHIKNSDIMLDKTWMAIHAKGKQ